MIRQEEFRHLIDLSKTVLNQGMAVAGQFARKVALEAVRQAKIVQPVIAETCRKARTELEHQVQLAKPVLRDSAKKAASALQTASQHVSSVSRTTLKRIPTRMALGVAIGLCGMTALALTLSPKTASKSLLVQNAPVDLPRDTELSIPVETAVQPDDDTTPNSPLSLQNAIQPVVAPVVDPTQEQRRQREQELAQLRQQALLELQQAEDDYNYAVQQWNAEVAACQQGNLPPGYTPQQMGRFAAMGVRLQPRQPNQALLYAAQQAEQRYLQARDNYQRLVNAQ